MLVEFKIYNILDEVSIFSGSNRLLWNTSSRASLLELVLVLLLLLLVVLLEAGRVAVLVPTLDS